MKISKLCITGPLPLMQLSNINLEWFIVKYHNAMRSRKIIVYVRSTQLLNFSTNWMAVLFSIHNTTMPQ